MLGKQKIKYIQSLGQKKQRDEEGLFLAEGPKLVADLMATVPGHVQEIYALKEWIDACQPSKGFSITEVTDAELEKMSQLKTPNEVLAIIRKFESPASPAIKGKLSLVLDTIQDPGNMGTIIRVADWFGIGTIICSADSADAYNPKVVQATMGSIARVKLFYTDLTAWLPQQDIRIFATALEGKDITRMHPLQEGLIIIGNESKGIREEILALAHERITIPRKGKAESLNAGVAAGIVLARLAT